jgi:uncharacterized alpha-E superfamily protein
VLSRIAESLFWVGRYVERAEGTARILDVHVHHLVEAFADQEPACRSLIEVMGLPQPDGSVTVRSMIDLLAFDRDNTSSIVSSLSSARDNARGVRESISAEMWECLNATWHALPDPFDRYSVGANDFFRYVKERATLFAGLTDATTSRDDTWRFLVLGRSVERVDMTCRLLSSRVSHTPAAPDWVMLLGSCSAYESFLRTYQREVTPERVVEFLLLDRLFPRSVMHALSTAETCLAELDPDGQLGRQHDARRILGQARAALEYESLTTLLSGVLTRLVTLQTACSAATEALTTRYFNRVDSVAWTRGDAGIAS